MRLIGEVKGLKYLYLLKLKNNYDLISVLLFLIKFNFYTNAQAKSIMPEIIIAVIISFGKRCCL